MKRLSRNPNQSSRKQAQLCAQAREAIYLALGDATDARLHDLHVEAVVPALDGARLVVVVAPARTLAAEELDDLVEALFAARHWLRRQVAAEIHRKRAPELTFQVRPGGESPLAAESGGALAEVIPA